MEETKVQAGFNGKTFALGLAWYHLPGERPLREARQQVRDIEAEVGIGVLRRAERQDEEGSRVVYYQVGLSSDAADVGAYSAAATLADHFADVVVVEPLENGQYWICVIAGGEVLPGGDQLVGEEIVDDALTDLLGELGAALDRIFVCAPETLAENHDLESDFSDGFGALLEAQSIPVRRAHKVRKLTGISWPAVGLVALLIACSLGYFAYDQWQARQESSTESYGNLSVQLPDDTRVSVGDAVERADEEGVSREDRLAAARQEEIQWLRNDLRSQDPASLYAEVRRFVQGFDRHRGGWVATDAVYDISDPDAVTISWEKASGMALARTLEDAVGEDTSVRFDLNGEQATSIHELGDFGMREIDDVLDYLENTDFDHLALMDALAGPELEWSISRGSLGDRPEPIEGIEGSLAEQRQLRVPVFEFEADLEGSLDHAALQRLLQDAEPVILSRITADLEQQNNWIIYGDLYER